MNEIYVVLDVEAMGMVENPGHDGLPDAWPWLHEALANAVTCGAMQAITIPADVILCSTIMHSQLLRGTPTQPNTTMTVVNFVRSLIEFGPDNPYIDQEELDVRIQEEQ